MRLTLEGIWRDEEMDELSVSGAKVLAALPGLPGGRELLELARGRDDVELIGGAARDLLTGATPRELDVVVGGDAPAFAHELAARLGVPSGADPEGLSGVTVHERFGTALLWWQEGRIDIALRRAESYSEPGALPEVREGTQPEDLSRRDFTVNAIAVGLGGERTGEISSVPHALEDLASGRLRVLHERSFLDDPTRLLRLARYLARLGFEPEERTAELASEALAAGMLARVSGGRIGAELRLALAEADPVGGFAKIDELGILRALNPPLQLDEALARRAIALLPSDCRADLLLLGTLLLSMTPKAGEDSGRAMFGLLDDLEFTAPERDRAIKTAVLAPVLSEELRDVHTPSELRSAVRSAPLEAVALAGALGDAEGVARKWLKELRHVRLTITGDDLLAAGVPAGPEIGQRLELALGQKLDGELAEGREAELNAAMEGL